MSYSLFTRLGFAVPGASGPLLPASDIEPLFPRSPLTWVFGPDVATLTAAGGVIAPIAVDHPPTWGAQYVRTESGVGYGLRTPFNDSTEYAEIFAHRVESTATRMLLGAGTSDSLGDVLLSTGTPAARGLRIITRGVGTNLDLSLGAIDNLKWIVGAVRHSANKRSIYVKGVGWVHGAATKSASAQKRVLGNDGLSTSGYTGPVAFAEYGYFGFGPTDNEILAAVDATVARCVERTLTVHGV